MSIIYLRPVGRELPVDGDEVEMPHFTSPVAGTGDRSPTVTEHWNYYQLSKTTTLVRASAKIGRRLCYQLVFCLGVTLAECALSTDSGKQNVMPRPAEDERRLECQTQ